MPATVDFTGLDRLRARLAKIAEPNAAPLMFAWMKIIDEDNRRGVMAGLDKDGAPMIPVKYRPKKPGGEKTTLAQRLGAKANRRGRYGGMGPLASGLHNNLTTAEYELLGGPPLAPRGRYSRVITNLKVGYQRLYTGRASAVWEAFGYWDEVVSVKGIPFLMAHFTGAATGRGKRTVLPRRDLRGVRPTGMQQARSAFRAWAIDVIRGSAAHAG